jgi:hypothetical protein
VLVRGSVYTVYNDDGAGGKGDSNSVKLGKSIVNALVIVGCICAATFLVVCLYKFRCMKVKPVPRHHTPKSNAEYPLVGAQAIVGRVPCAC